MDAFLEVRLFDSDALYTLPEFCYAFENPSEGACIYIEEPGDPDPWDET